MGYSNSSDLPGLPEPPEWFSPWSYPSRVDDALAIQIATEVAQGSTIAAAGMQYGVSPSRLTAWLKWGAEAYDRDAGPNDYHAAYLNLYLKVMQATGISSVTLQQELRRQNPTWWLAHHPEVRGEWGGDPYQKRLDAPDEPEETVEAEVSTMPKLDAERMRNVLKMLLEGGAMTAGQIDAPSTPTVATDAPSNAPIVDAETREEGAG